MGSLHTDNRIPNIAKLLSKMHYHLLDSKIMTYSKLKSWGVHEQNCNIKSEYKTKNLWADRLGFQAWLLTFSCLYWMHNKRRRLAHASCMWPLYQQWYRCIQTHTHTHNCKTIEKTYIYLFLKPELITISLVVNFFVS